MDAADAMDEGRSATGPSRRQSVDSGSNTPSASLGKHPAPSPASGSGPASSAQSKRKRGPGIVTPNACTECRKKRAKCDGQTPCSRCKTQDVECVYEIPVRQSKENLRAEIEQLRRQQRSNENVLAALVQPGQWEEVLQRLRAGQSVATISQWLGGTLPSGGGTMPAFGSALAPAANMTPLATFSGSNAASFTPMAATRGDTVSPVSAHPSGLRQELDRNSPWAGPFSAKSQATTQSDSQMGDAMSWTMDHRVPTSRIGTWVETISEGKEGREGREGKEGREGRDSRDGSGSQDRRDPKAPQTSRYRGFDQVLAPEMAHMMIPAETWTNITADSSLVQHLLALYFCWEYPTFASLSKEHFLKDFQDGRQRYCSSILVNALLALGCRFSSQPNTRSNPDDPYTSGDHFFKECQRLFYDEENHHTLTTIQALGIMSIREASCGRDSESWYFAGQSIRLAIEMGLHRIQEDRGDEDELAVQAATFWGAFALDHAWSLATGSLPQCSCFPQLPPKPGIIDDIEASLWIPYTDDGTPLQQSCQQPSNVRSVYKCFCQLSELVHQSLYILHSPGRPLTSRDLLNIYTQYLNWYSTIPDVLRLGRNFTPAVLFAHMYYHFAILLLFRPLIKLRIIGSSIAPRDVCAQAADAIQGLLRSYSQLYTLRRTPSFVPYFVLTSSIMHLAIGASKAQQSLRTDADEGTPAPSQPSQDQQGAAAGPAGLGAAPVQELDQGPVPDPVSASAKMDPKVTEAINQGIADLTEMAPCHHFAEQALNILRHLARKWNIEINIKVEIAADEASDSDTDRRLRPLTASLNFFAPNVSDEDLNCAWGSAIPNSSAAAAGRTIGKSAANMENPLFWPFPMQGRPMLPSGKLLRDAGFELI